MDYGPKRSHLPLVRVHAVDKQTKLTFKPEKVICMRPIAYVYLFILF